MKRGSLPTFLAGIIACCAVSSTAFVPTGQRPLLKASQFCVTSAINVNKRPLRAVSRRGLQLRMQGIDIDLSQGGNNDKKKKVDANVPEHDILLAELAFSNPSEMPKIIERNLQKLDANFFAFLDKKIKSTPDKSEAETLSLLKDAVEDLLALFIKNMKEMQGNGGATDVSSRPVDGELAFSDEDLATASYDQLIDELKMAAPSAVEAQYDRFDMKFLERLQERIDDADEVEKEKLTTLNNSIQACMSARIQKASQALQGVLRAGDPDKMMKQLMILNAKGGLDESVILLLEANIEQAKKAGAGPAIQVLTQLRDKAIDYKDASMPEEIKLIRQLLRTEGKDARRTILIEAFRPREKLLDADGMETKQQQTDGRRFVQAMRNLIEKFGNVDQRFKDRLNEIATESELVARDLFGLEEKDVKTLQEEAFSARSVSVWDLEQLEEAYVNMGDKAPWMNPSRAGWDEEGNMVIGGESYKKGDKGNDGKIIF